MGGWGGHRAGRSHQSLQSREPNLRLKDRRVIWEKRGMLSGSQEPLRANVRPVTRRQEDQRQHPKDTRSPGLKQNPSNEAAHAVQNRTEDNLVLGRSQLIPFIDVGAECWPISNGKKK